MAIGNFMFSGSYTVVEQLIYGKQNKILELIVNVDHDSSKYSVANRLSYTLSTNQECQAVTGISATPPTTPADGDVWLVQADATGAWAGNSGKVATFYDSLSGWSIVDRPEIVFFYASNSTYWRKSSTGFSQCVGSDSRVFDSKFSPTAIGGADNNILKTIYVHLKTLPEFAGCTDV
jgi:hypothetical protein